MIYTENRERQIDMVERAIARFRKTGHPIWPPQDKIYENLEREVVDKTVVEAGCGIGWGSALLSHQAYCLMGTDKSPKHVDFAQAFYPWIDFSVWDIAQGRFVTQGDVVIAIDVIEHVGNYRKGLANLIAAARDELFVSTPNRNSDTIADDQPANCYHVREFTPDEFCELAYECGTVSVEILEPETWAPLDVDTKKTPLVYRISV